MHVRPNEVILFYNLFKCRHIRVALGATPLLEWDLLRTN